MAAKYVEQLERTKRYLKRFFDITNGIPHTQPSRNYEDDVYAFFQNCYHLKDWIKNDPVCRSWNVEAFINSNRDLQICADLCNALKHLTLTNPPRSAEAPQFSGGYTHLELRDGSTERTSEVVHIAMTYTITTTSGEIDAFDLGKRCVGAWQHYIDNNISTP